jgi:hypothetical protein
MEGKVSLLTGCPRDCGRFSPPQPRTSRKNRRLVTVSPAAAATLSERLRVFEQAKALSMHVRVAARGFARRNISGNWTTRIGSGLGVSKQSGKQFILRRRERVRDCDSFPREAFLQVFR